MKQTLLLNRFTLSVLLSFGVMFSGGQASAQSQVGASIRPLQMIAAAVTEGISEPVLIIGPGGDPHHYSLRPSDRRRISESDLLLWGGPDLESYLEGVTTQTRAPWLTAIALEGMHLLIDEGLVDQHFWLDSDNAGLVAASLSRRLIELDPQNALAYQANLDEFLTRLSGVDQQIADSFAQQTWPDFGVYHNAFSYFEARYGVEHALTIVDHEELSPGIRHYLSVRAQINELGLRCILVEPEVNQEELSTVLDADALHFVSIDVLGWDVPLSAYAYTDFLLGIAEDIQACLR